MGLGFLFLVPIARLAAAQAAVEDEKCGSESGVLQTHVLYPDVLAVTDIDEARALLILVGTFGGPLSAKPESTVVSESVAVHQRTHFLDILRLVD